MCELEELDISVFFIRATPMLIDIISLKKYIVDIFYIIQPSILTDIG